MNVLVTGGARGIGAGIVLKLAEAGNSVAFCGRGGIECAESFLAELRSKFSGKFEYYQCDISSSDGRKKCWTISAMISVVSICWSIMPVSLPKSVPILPK